MTTSEIEINNPVHPMLRVFSIRDFRLLWLGGSISILGSQFSFIAMPWLVLQLTGDPLALGIVMALAGIPRAVFILIGGAITDRFSPRTILLTCDWINFVLAGLAAVLVYIGAMQVWMLYFFSLFTGLVSGFVIPAANSVVPTLVPEQDLQAGNSVTMGSSQLAGFVGPALAGIVIGLYSHSTFGIAVAFAVDALSFGISAIALWMMRGGGKQLVESGTEEPIWKSIQAAMGYLWNHKGLQFMFIIMAVVNFLFTGPVLVGIPVLADQRLAEGAKAFGFLMAAYAGGNLGGYILAGVLPKPNGRGLSIFLLVQLAAFGVGLAILGWITQTWIGSAMMFLLGLGNGFTVIVIFTWIQQRTPKEMLGRMMSIVMLASMGLVPLSQVLSGMVSRWNLTGLFALGGSLILLTTLWAAFQPALKSLSREMAGD
jgi:MFS family permease